MRPKEPTEHKTQTIDPLLVRAESPRGSPSRFRQPTRGGKHDEYLPGKVDLASRRNRSGNRSNNSSRGGTPKLQSGSLPKFNLPMPDHNSRPYVKSPLSPPVMQALTPASGIHTPGSARSGEPNDYFGLGIAVTKDGTPKLGEFGPSSGGNEHYTSRRANFAPSAGTTPGESPGVDPRKGVRTTTSTRRERDKKNMLSKALEKANTAVLLDNAQNFAAALDAYNDACMLLQEVMDRTTGPDDRTKLDAIRATYATRMDELTAMQRGEGTDGAEKQLPPRPDSNGSDETAPQLAVLKPVSPIIGAPPPGSASGAAQSNPAPSTAQGTRTADRTRDSFLTSAIREVEGGRTGAFLGPLWERSKSPGIGPSEDKQRPKEELHGPDAPLPLTPRSQSPQPPQHTSNTNPVAGTGEPGSWLNTVDESDSDAGSLHTGKRGPGMRRRDISDGAHKPPTDFDTAFDQAVEAAYEQGYEPDQGDEEQQMMDDIAKDYMDQDFNFSAKNMSSLPRSNANRLSTLDEDSSVLPRARHQAQASTSTAQTIGEDNAQSHVVDGVPKLSALRKRAPSTASRRTDTSQRDLDVTPWEADDARSEVTPWETQQSTPRSEVTPWETQRPHGSVAQSIAPSMAPSMASGPLKDRRNRLSNGSLKPLTIETASIHSARRKRAMSNSSKRTEYSQKDLEVTPWEAADPGEVTPWETQATTAAEVTPWDVVPGPSDSRLQKLTGVRKADREGVSVPSSAVSDSGSSMVGDIASPKNRFVRTQKSSLSLRETVAETDLSTPTSTVFSTSYAKRNDSTGHLSQKSLTATANGSMPPLPVDGGQQGGFYLFDTSLGRSIEQPMSSSPRTTKEAAPPAPFEPCPDSNLLRPFWLLRSISNTATHPRGAYITTRLFMPHEAWLNRSAKLKNVEDKIAACDMLTAALAPLDGVNTLDADAVLEDLQKFEEIMERVQMTLIKKLGHEVGVGNATTMFKDADRGGMDGAMDSKDSKNAAKFSWRKLRGKPSVSGVTNAPGGGSGDTCTMSTVPMTSFNGVEKRTGHRRDALRDATFEGPHKEYMASIARLCEAAQVIGKSLSNQGCTRGVALTHPNRPDCTPGRGSWPQTLLYNTCWPRTQRPTCS